MCGRVCQTSCQAEGEGSCCHVARPACECAHGRFSAYFTAGVYLNCCLHLLSSNVKACICAWLEAQEESLKSSFFILSSQKSEGIVWENEGRKKMFYFPISPALSFPCLSAEAHLCLLWSIIRY